MAVNSKNLGQVAGISIGNTPPENIKLIWWDSTPSQKCHKLYDSNLNQWVVINRSIISSTTYSELTNLAKNSGLSLGQWFQIRDKGNSIALAITSTKVQYADEIGNILIDDLGTNVQYHVTSSNLSIDDIAGTFDSVNKKLTFVFNETVPDFTADDYILGKIKRNNTWNLAKYKISSFISKVTGNSITWNGGFFFNFSKSISDILDKKGGVVSKDTYDIDKQSITTDIQNVGKENQTIIDNTNKAISNATSSTVIYDKRTPAVETGGEPTDVVTGDKLITIISKFQRYINKFKFATGIKISKNFTESETGSNINNNDTVESAFSKIQWYLRKIMNGTDGVELTRTLSPTKHTMDQGDNLTNVLENFLFSIDELSSIKVKNYDLIISNNADFLNMASLINANVGSVLVRKGIYTSNNNNLYDIDLSNINHNVLIDFETGVFVNITNNLPVESGSEMSVKTLFYSTIQKDNIFFNMNFCVFNCITNNSEVTRVIPFYKLSNIKNAILNGVGKCYFRFFECSKITNVKVLNSSSLSSFMNCERLIMCEGGFIQSSSMIMCRGSFSTSQNGIFCTGTGSIAMPSDINGLNSLI